MDFEGHFLTKGPFMGFPTDETDELWEGLYNCKLPSITGPLLSPFHTGFNLLYSTSAYEVHVGTAM